MKKVKYSLLVVAGYTAGMALAAHSIRKATIEMEKQEMIKTKREETRRKEREAIINERHGNREDRFKKWMEEREEIRKANREKHEARMRKIDEDHENRMKEMDEDHKKFMVEHKQRMKEGNQTLRSIKMLGNEMNNLN